MNIKILEKALKKSWGKDICFPSKAEKWSEQNPAYGQCLSTALVVQDYLGGEILHVKFPGGINHYYNLIEGKTVDLTRSQFSETKKFPAPEIIPRSELKETPRYKHLKRRVEECLSNKK